jgi:hypothetical protein
MEKLVRRFEGAVRDRPGPERSPAPVPTVEPSRIGDPPLLARLHEAALFLRAFPRTARDVRVAERILGRIPARMEALSRGGADLSALDEFETVGIGGTSLTMDFSFGMARWLARRHGGAVSIAWDEVEKPERLAPALSRALPFLPERALADVGVDYEAWLRAALPSGTRDGGLGFLVGLFEALPDDDERAERWDPLGLAIRWTLGASSASRTIARLPSGRLFVDAAPLVSRRDVSIARECRAPAPRIRRLTLARGRAFLDSARAAVGVRYRELHAFTWGNPADVVVTDAGRGLSIWCCGLLPEHRLPLRAGYGFLLARNGVPIGYGDAYALGDRLDLSFNVFYAFRDGESAFAYSKTVAFFRALLGSRSVAVDPYQIGKGNDEAIASGAFWFYRKLGFASASPPFEALTRREEALSASRPGRRTSAATLRRITAAGVTLDLPSTTPALWSAVSLDAAGLAIGCRQAAAGLSPGVFGRAREKRVARALGLPIRLLPPRLARALRGLAPVLDLVPDLSRLRADERGALRKLVVRKAGPSEAGFARLLARAGSLAAAVKRACGNRAARR